MPTREIPKQVYAPPEAANSNDRGLYALLAGLAVVALLVVAVGAILAVNLLGGELRASQEPSPAVAQNPPAEEEEPEQETPPENTTEPEDGQLGVGDLMFAGGLVFMTIGALVSIGGTQSGVALIAPRSLYALSREGMVPAFLGKVHPRFATPVASIWLTGAIVVVLTITGTFAQLILLNVAARLYQCLMVCVSAAILRVRGGDSETSFRLPLGPTIPVVAALLCVVLLAQQSLFEILATIAALAVGLILYFLSRRAAREES